MKASPTPKYFDPWKLLNKKIVVDFFSVKSLKIDLEIL
jgi:hypothetical protein